MQWPVLGMALAMAMAPAAAEADALDGASLPQGTHWVLHVDVDAARQTPLWTMAGAHLTEARRATMLARAQAFENATGMKLPEDLHDFTLSGTSYDESDACMRIHATVDVARTIKLLRAAQDFSETPHNGHTILSWHDRGRDRQVCAAIVGEVILLAAKRQTVEGALDTMDGKSPAVAATSPLLRPAMPENQRAKALLWMAGENLSELPRARKAESPLLSHMQAASVSLEYAHNMLGIETSVVASSEDAATEIQTVAEGMKALIMLASGDEHAKPGTKILGQSLAALSLTARGNEFHAAWNLPLDKVEAVWSLSKTATVPAVDGTVEKPSGDK